MHRQTTKRTATRMKVKREATPTRPRSREGKIKNTEKMRSLTEIDREF
jgi:hypothetical protein